jgi:membrane-bound ClpP family serine protease
MFWLVVVTLILIGLAFLLLEILVIPGTGVAGIIGFILLGIGVWQAYVYYGSITGHWVLGGTIVATVAVLAYSLRAKTWRRVALNSEINSRVNLIDEDKIKPGDEGKSVSRLVPTGKALFNKEFYEVRTMGEFLDPGLIIVIEKIEDHKIFVKQKEK